MAELSAKVHLDSSEVDAATAKVQALEARTEAVRTKIRGLNNDLALAMNRVDRIIATLAEFGAAIQADAGEIARQQVTLADLQAAIRADQPAPTVAVRVTDLALGFQCACPTCSGWVSVGMEAVDPTSAALTLRCSDCRCVYHAALSIEKQGS